jgi:hypothetical protein
MALIHTGDVQKKEYKKLSLIDFVIEPTQMLNSTAQPNNIYYQINVDGTSNLTTTLQAPAFATKGHFY